MLYVHLVSYKIEKYRGRFNDGLKTDNISNYFVNLKIYD